MRLAALCVGVIAAFMPGSAWGAPLPIASCWERSVLLELLTETYGEIRFGGGENVSGNLNEVYIAPGGTTWTVTVVYPDSKTCIASTGEGWKTNPDEPAPEPEGNPS